MARKYKNFSEQVFVQDLNRHDWGNIYNSEDPSKAWDLFVAEFSGILGNVCTLTMTYLFG